MSFLAKVMVCETAHDNPFLFITDSWTVEQAKRYARSLGFKPLYCVNVRERITTWEVNWGTDKVQPR